jgi:LCP family protein required for cell wall assembly
VGRILLVVLLLFLAAATYVGVRLYSVWNAIDDGPIFATPVPVTGTPEPTPPPLEPLNILLIGIDRRDGEEGVRNDVNIVVHVDLVEGFATMLSIPRDTLVNIPGYGYWKINAAYSFGEQDYRDAGGGPTLVKRTVEGFLGMRIHYYAEVNFHGFERIVDLLGGVTVDVPFPIVDNEYPTEDYGYTRLYIPAGLQHMNGRTALRYARSRHGNDDISRNQRQQQVLFALREKALSSDLLIELIIGSERMNELLQEFGDSFQTDIPKETLVRLAGQADKISENDIVGYALDWSCLSEISGTSDLQPSMPCVYDLRERMQTPPRLLKLREEGAYIEVRNGTWTPQLAGRTAEYLRRQGFSIVDILQDPNAGNYTHTLILDGDDHVYTRSLLADLLGVDSEYIYTGEEFTPTADIVIILGEDYELPEE